MFKEGDKVVCVNTVSTQSRFGLSDTMNKFVGHEGTISHARGKSINIQECPGTWWADDFDYASKKRQTPKYVMKRIGRPCRVYNSHQLKYKIYNKKGDAELMDNGGSCFESYADSLENFVYDYGFKGARFRWIIDLKHPKSKAWTLKEAEILRWFQNWKRIGYIHKDSSIKDLVAGVLDMPCTKDANDVYMAVCVARYLTEQPDVVRYTLDLVDREWRFLTAQAMWQYIFGERGHQLTSLHMVPAGIRKQIDRHAGSIALTARTQWLYIQAKRARRDKYGFSWWYQHEKHCPGPGTEDFETIMKNIQNYGDLKYYNPYEGVFMK